jgi:hypothetical protein
MESAIVKNLQPEFSPVAVVWSNTIPEDARQFKEGKFGCVVYLLAEASTRGRLAGGSRTTIACNGGRSALGFGVDFDASAEMLDRCSAVFSKGLASAEDKEAYRAHMETSPEAWRSLYEYGERRHCSVELAKQWIQEGLPRYNTSYEYVLFKPLNRVTTDDQIKAVIFPVNPVELAGLVTLAGSVMSGSDCIRYGQGPDCTSLTAYAYAENESVKPRAVLGMMGIDGREVMRKRFRDDIVTLTLPEQLFWEMEREAHECLFQTPAWQALSGNRPFAAHRKGTAES